MKTTKRNIITKIQKGGPKNVWFKADTLKLADELSEHFGVSRSTVVEDAIKELAKKYIIL